MEEEVREKVPVVTILFMGINILVWLVLELAGDTTDSVYMLEHGAAYPPYILEYGEWWRLFSCMFLHFGAEHLVNNMLMLGVTGSRLEHVIGSIQFAILYLFSGVCGSFFSFYQEVRSMDPAVSAGASGAVFGIVGALIAWAVWNRGRVEGLTTKGLLGMAALSLYYGFSTAGVDNWGHIGGLAGGFLAGCIAAVFSKSRRYR